MSRIARRLGLVLALSMAVAVINPAFARLTQQQLDSIEARPHLGVRLPDLQLRDLDGNMHDLAALLDRPAVVIFADYTCETLCGPVLAFAGHALAGAGLPPEQYRLIVIGLDPKDSAADARRMRDAQLGAGSAMARDAMFAFADDATIKALTAALGYRFTYDAALDQYAHPDAAFVFGADGRLSRVLSGLGLSGNDMRLALVEAGQGKVGNIADQVHLLCYGFDPARGTYNLEISRVLSASALATMLALGGVIGFLSVSGRRRRTRARARPARARRAAPARR
jgi:protein SCO1/2